MIYNLIQFKLIKNEEFNQKIFLFLKINDFMIISIKKINWDLYMIHKYKNLSIEIMTVIHLE